jgi:hypothetical protein
MSRNILVKLLFVLLFFAHVFCHGIDEFPITNTISCEKTNGAIRSVHTELKSTSKTSKDATNFFVCGFRFKIKGAKKEEVWTKLYAAEQVFKSGAGEIDGAHKKNLEAMHEKFHEIASQGKEEHNMAARLIASIFGIVEARSEQEDGALKKAFKIPESPKSDESDKGGFEVRKKITQLARSPKITEDVVLTKLDAQALDRFLEGSSKQQSQLIKHLSSQLQNIKEEYKRTITSGSQRHYALINSDSEAKAIVSLGDERYLLNLIRKVSNEIENGAKIIAIEFHGYTTKDMCPLCYTNFNIVQYIANELAYDKIEPNVGFLGNLKWMLISEKLAEKSCQTAIIISSSEEFPDPKDNGDIGNPLWCILPSPHDSFEYSRVNQFRFQEAEEKEGSAPKVIVEGLVASKPKETISKKPPQVLTPGGLKIIQKLEYDVMCHVEKTAGFWLFKWTYITPVRLVLKDNGIVEEDFKSITEIKKGKQILFYKDKEHYYPSRTIAPLPTKPKGAFSPPQKISNRILARLEGTGYVVKDAGGGGDCGPLSILFSLGKALSEENVRTLREGVSAPMWSDYLDALGNIGYGDEDANPALDLFRSQAERIGTMGSWIEPSDFSHIARYIEKCIVLFTNNNNVWNYYYFDPVSDEAQILGKNVNHNATHEDSVRRVIERYRGVNPDTIFIYGRFGGVGSSSSSNAMGHYQAIVAVGK